MEAGMKRLFISSIVLLLLFLSVDFGHTLYAFQSEPHKFRGIKWGDSLKHIKGMVQTEPPDQLGVACFKRKGDKLQIGKSSIRSIQYCAFRDKFYWVEIDIVGSDNFFNLVKTFLQLYGLPQYRNDNIFFRSWIWKGNKLKVSLIYGNNTKEGTLTYEFIPIKEKRDNARDRLLEKSRRQRVNKLKQELGNDL